MTKARFTVTFNWSDGSTTSVQCDGYSFEEGLAEARKRDMHPTENRHAELVEIQIVDIERWRKHKTRM